MAERLHGMARFFGWLRALWRLYRDRRTPRKAKWLLTGLALAYLISPIDLVPEVIVPVAGLLDDAVLVPLLLWLVTRLAPASVRQRVFEDVGLHRKDARTTAHEASP